ncbi:MAG: BamA/TamA family outer membrane protein [Anaeromyxobacteraceae bacterium]
MKPRLVALLLFAAGCLTSRGTRDAPIVSAVRFDGVRSVDEEALAERLATHRPEGLLLREGHPLDSDALETDRLRIEAWYRERGYYRARVADVEVVPDGRGRVRITFRVEEGASISVGKVTVTGLDAAPEAQARVRRLPIAPGQRFDERRYDRARAAIADALHATGWGDAKVTQAALVVPDEGIAEVTYAVEAGPRLKFGAVEIVGAVVVPAERIAGKVQLALHPGDWFDESLLGVAQARVFEMGVFGGVRVVRGPTDAARGDVPIQVQVTEAPFRSLSAGPGIAFQQNRWEARVAGNWTHRNFLGGLRRFATDGRAGWAFLPSPFAPVKEGFVGLAGTELLQPATFGSAVDATVRLEAERSIEEAYSYWSERARVGLPARIGPRFIFVPTYAVEAYEVEGIAGTQAVTSAPLLASCAGRLCVLSYVEERFALDLRDDPIETRKGAYFAVSVQEGFRLGGYGYQYLRFLPEARGFVPLGRRAVLAARGRVGALVPVAEASPPPIVARFTGGGPLSMRGYYVGRLSPLQRQDGEYVPVGGNGLVDGSIELRFDATRKLGLALFLDAGNVSRPSSDGLAWLTAADPTLLQYAAGLGLRYRTPVGPLRLDVAARMPNPFAVTSEPPGLAVLSDACTAQPTSTYPCVHHEPLVSVHLTLGEAF